MPLFWSLAEGTTGLVLNKQHNFQTLNKLVIFRTMNEMNVTFVRGPTDSTRSGHTTPLSKEKAKYTTKI